MYKFIGNLPLKKKLMFSYTFFILMSVLFVFFLSYRIYSAIIVDEIKEYSLDTLKNKLYVLDTNLKQYDLFTRELISDKNVIKLLNTDNDYDNIENNYAFNDLASKLRIQLQTPYIVTVAACSEYGIYYSPQAPILLWNFLSELNSEDNDIYRNIAQKSGGLAIFDSEQLNNISIRMNNDLFIIGRLVQDIHLKPLGYVLLFVRVNFFSDLTDNLRFGDDCAFYVFSNDRTILFSEEINPTYREYIQTAADRIFAGENSITLKDSNGTLFSITSYTSDYSGWTLVNIVPISYLLSGTIVNRNILIFFCVFFALFALIPTAIIANGINKPLNSLIHVMRKISQGNLSLRAQVVSGPETNELCDHFNYMLDEINKLIVENDLKQKALTESEFSILQAQINPHFLYNTLNSLRWIAIINEQDQIKELIDSLTKLLMNILGKNGELVTIEHELSVLQSYITLMKVRYKNFHVNVEINDEEKSYKILKLILQPLIENSIIHGFNGINYVGQITISFKNIEDCIMVTVMDNGVGIQPWKMDSILKPENTRDELFNNIGINNVHKRIQLHYGDAYGVEISGNEPAGTIIKIKLPVIQ